MPFEFRGRQPKSDGWYLVAEYLDWLESIEIAASRWNALSNMFPLESCPTVPSSALPWFKAATQSIQTASDLGDRLIQNLQRDTGMLSPTSINPTQIRTNADSQMSLRYFFRSGITRSPTGFPN